MAIPVQHHTLIQCWAEPFAQVVIAHVRANGREHDVIAAADEQDRETLQAGEISIGDEVITLIVDYVSKGAHAHQVREVVHVDAAEEVDEVKVRGMR